MTMISANFRLLEKGPQFVESVVKNGANCLECNTFLSSFEALLRRKTIRSKSPQVCVRLRAGGDLLLRAQKRRGHQKNGLFKEFDFLKNPLFGGLIIYQTRLRARRQIGIFCLRSPRGPTARRRRRRRRRARKRAPKAHS